jgi:hypothetical protein
MTLYKKSPFQYPGPTKAEVITITREFNEAVAELYAALDALKQAIEDYNNGRKRDLNTRSIAVVATALERYRSAKELVRRWHDPYI